MKLIAGLGNPGPEYVFSRHNAGWLVVDSLVSRFSCGTAKMQFSSMAWTAFHNGEKVLLLKPLTWMNLSGKALREAVDYFRLSWEDVLIIYDDVALPFGRLRMRKKGSAGGHKGMISVLAAAGTLEVSRLRIGVGAVPDEKGIISWVLGNFSREERAVLPDLTGRAADAASLWITLGPDEGMNRVNGMA